MLGASSPRDMRGVLIALTFLAVAPFVAAHDGPHGLHVTDVNFSFRVPSVLQEIRFAVHNDPDEGPTSGLTVEVAYVYSAIRQVFELDELGPGEGRYIVLRAPQQVATYACVQAIANGESSDPACALTEGVALG